MTVATDRTRCRADLPVVEGLAVWGWDDGWARALAETRPDGDPGRVVRVHKVGHDVRTAAGRVFAITRERVREPLDSPAAGDWVALGHETAADHPVITAVLQRRTLLVRRDPSGRARPQVLAANPDVVAFAHGADRPVNAHRVERGLALAGGSGAVPLLLLTKADLDMDGTVAAALGQVRGAAEVLATSVRSGRGLERLAAVVSDGGTLALVGESGAGKSSLVNALLGEHAVEVGAVRAHDAKGRHTTVRRELLPLPAGGTVLDTPGVRAIGLWPGYADLDVAFPEIAAAAAGCRFQDCRHEAEPACAVRAAVDAGTASATRFASLQRLAAELADTAAEVERQRWR